MGDTNQIKKMADMTRSVFVSWSTGGSRLYSRRKDRGQATIEFTFAMTLTLILMFALAMVFRWVGLDLADRRFAHEKLLTNTALRPEQQLNPDFYRPRKIDAAFRQFNLK